MLSISQSGSTDRGSTMTPPPNKPSPLLEGCQGQAAVSLELQHKVCFFFFFLNFSQMLWFVLSYRFSSPPLSFSSQGFLTFLGFRRLRDITFQEEYNTLFPNSPSLLP